MEPTINVLLGALVSVCVGLVVRHVWEDRSGRKQPTGFMVEDAKVCAVSVCSFTDDDGGKRLK